MRLCRFALVLKPTLASCAGSAFLAASTCSLNALGHFAKLHRVHPEGRHASIETLDPKALNPKSLKTHHPWLSLQILLWSLNARDL